MSPPTSPAQLALDLFSEGDPIVTIILSCRSNQDIVSQGVLEISDSMLYDVDRNRAPYPHGPLDPRLVIQESWPTDSYRHMS